MRLVKFVLTAFTVLALNLPKPVGYVNDFGQLLSSSYVQELEANLQSFEKETTAEIAVVTIDSLEGTTVEDYAVRLFENWQIGQKEKDNGVLILVAKQDRKMRIEVGYGLEPIITDGRSGRIIREQMQSAFRANDYEGGIKAAVIKIEEYIRSGEPPQGAEATREQAQAGLAWLIFIIIFGVYLISFITRGFTAMARTKRIWPGGLAGMSLGAILGFLVGAIVVWVILFGLFGLLLDWLLSKNYKKLKGLNRPTSFWSSWGGFSSGGSSHGSGSSFGGFGGGSSGGGGASGSW